MKLSLDELIELIERTIAGDDIGRDWDDMVRCARARDGFTKYWATRISKVESLFPPQRESELFDPIGMKYLRELLDELRAIRGNQIQ